MGGGRRQGQRRGVMPGPMMSAAASPLGTASGLGASLGPTECHSVAKGAAEDSCDLREISDAGKIPRLFIFLPTFEACAMTSSGSNNGGAMLQHAPAG